MATEAAALFVRVSADISDANRKLDTISQKTEKSGSIMRNALGSAIGFGASTLALAGLGNAFSGIESGVIGMNAQLETSTLQFATLMGSSSKAEAHVRSLFDFAAKTPFETGPVITASRYMQTFGGAALNTTKNLTLFGNAAAATSSNIDEVSFWMSRAYAAIQGGQPFGEARMRLMELGILSPQVAGQLEKLQASGAKGDKVWGALTASLGKFDGAMAKQAETWEGVTSTMSDNVKMMLATAGKPLFDMLKDAVKWFNALASSPAFQGAIKGAAEGIAGAFRAIASVGGAIANVLGQIARVVGDALFPAFETLETALNPIRGVFDTVTGALEGLFSGGFDPGADIIDNFNESLAGIAPRADSVGGVIAGLAQTIYTSVWGMVQSVVPMLANLGKQFIAWIGPMIPPLLAELANFATSMLTWAASMLPVIAAQLMTWAQSFIDWIAPMIPPFLEQLAAWGLQAVGWLLDTGLPMMIDALSQVGGAFLAWIGPMVAKLPDALMQFAIGVGQWLLNTAIPTLVPKMFALAGKLLNGLIEGLLKLPGVLWDFLVNSLLPALIKWGPQLLQTGNDLMRGFARAIANGLVGLLEGAINSIIRGINSFSIPPIHIKFGPVDETFGGWGGFNLGYVKLPRFEKGAWDIPGTTLGILHRGEMVLPAPVASRVRAGGGGGDTYVYNFDIGSFYGSDPHAIDRLAAAIGDRVRTTTIRRTVTAS